MTTDGAVAADDDEPSEDVTSSHKSSPKSVQQLSVKPMSPPRPDTTVEENMPRRGPSNHCMCHSWSTRNNEASYRGSLPGDSGQMPYRYRNVAPDRDLATIQAQTA